MTKTIYFLYFPIYFASVALLYSMWTMYPFLILSGLKRKEMPYLVKWLEDCG